MSSDENTFPTVQGRQWLVYALREAGKVKRCHTVPCHHTPTVNEHSGNMVDLLLVLHPQPTMNLVRACRLHDTPERWSGDIPAPAKQVLGKYLKEFEARSMEALGLGYTLSPYEFEWLHALDKLELLMWARDEQAMGNQNVIPMIADLVIWFTAASKDGRIPNELLGLMDGFCWVRLTDYPPFDMEEEEA